MAAATVTSKGQVTVPVEARRRLGIRAGTRLEFIVKDDDRLEVMLVGGRRDLTVERSDLAWQALNLYEEGPGDFSDYVIGLAGRSEGAESTCTFDRRAAKRPLFRLVSG